MLHDVPPRLRIRVSDPSCATPSPVTPESAEARIACVDVEEPVKDLEIRFGPVD